MLGFLFCNGYTLAHTKNITILEMVVLEVAWAWFGWLIGPPWLAVSAL